MTNYTDNKKRWLKHINFCKLAINHAINYIINALKKTLKILSIAIRILTYIITRPTGILLICSIAILILAHYNLKYPEFFMIEGKEKPSIMKEEEEDNIIEENLGSINDEDIIIKIIDIYFTRNEKYNCIKSYDYEGTIIFEIGYRDKEYKYKDHKHDENNHLDNLHKDIQKYYNKFSAENNSRSKRVCIMILDEENPEVAVYCII